MKCEALANGVANKIEFADSITEYNHIWDKNKLTYKLHNYSNDIDKFNHQERAVTVALRAWQLVTNLKFKRVYGDEPADINVYFKPQSTFRTEGVLAHAWYPDTSREGDVEINDRWDWVTHTALSNIGHPPLVPVLIHEFGHTLGLSHDTINKTAIMYPSFNLGEKKNDLGPSDKERIQSRYGERKLSQRILDYFMRRRDLGLDFR